MKVGVIGAGLVGSAWAIVFARAGHDVAMFDAVEGAAERSLEVIADRLRTLKAVDLIEDAAAIAGRIVVAASLAETVRDADYIQESVFETVEQKQKIFTELDRVVGPVTLIGSSSSGIPASVFTEHVACRDRCLIAHPVNPPYLVPVVELVPAPWTAPETVRRVRTLMESVGQEPVELTREIEGFALNRLQGLLLAEAWRLVADGIMSVEDVDRTVSSGLGLRWSFIGPFETIDLNAPGGVADYARRFGPMYERIAGSRGFASQWHDDLIEKVEQQRRQALSEEQLRERSAWRDRRLMALLAHKRDAPG
ncbi:3-hydroxyacyl-CoA dehydrogenase [Acidiphilium sp. JA12-A1]|uniref:3-hydroxyacyl-CoA dehydrogenase n=1 Tax=Acidiphilium sp. JA12-A1 TaxID=1464546 RepID=UPI000461414B|nr:3-hydroxyacyl-CoA dehydrogenase [Acidiphilium sp. JA12-A1]KDM66095.1 L-carnitine dehydrogenase LcdH [Acidiphilium sp. JA12-A1]